MNVRSSVDYGHNNNDDPYSRRQSSAYGRNASLTPGSNPGSRPPSRHGSNMSLNSEDDPSGRRGSNVRRSSSMLATSMTMAGTGTCQSRRAREMPQFQRPFPQSGGTCSSSTSSFLHIHCVNISSRWSGLDCTACSPSTCSTGRPADGAQHITCSAEVLYFKVIVAPCQRVSNAEPSCEARWADAQASGDAVGAGKPVCAQHHQVRVCQVASPATCPDLQASVSDAKLFAHLELKLQHPTSWRMTPSGSPVHEHGCPHSLDDLPGRWAP